MSSSWSKSLPSNRIKAIQNLTQGEHLTNKVREMLGQPHKIESDIDSVDGVVMEILGMFDNTLSILTFSDFKESRYDRSNDVRSPRSWDDQKSEDSGESVKTVVPKTKRGCYKRRKTSSTFTKVTSNLIDDGYAWRKYGQKVILNAKHQRSYYRCTHKIEQGCKATKQVQKTDDEPPKYTITYNGQHTCKFFGRAPQIILDSPDHRDNSILLNFETNRIIEDTQVGPCLPSMKHTSNEGFPSLGLKHETVTLGENENAGPSFPLMKHAPKENFPLHLKNGQVSSFDHYIPWDMMAQLSQLPSEPMSMMLSGLDHEDIVVSPGVYSSTCSTLGYGIDDMLGSNDFCDFPFELCS